MNDICFSSAHRETRPSQEVSSKYKIPSCRVFNAICQAQEQTLHLGRFGAPFMGWRRGVFIHALNSARSNNIYACGRNNSQREWVQIPALPQIDEWFGAECFTYRKSPCLPVTGPAFPVLKAVNRNKAPTYAKELGKPDVC